MTNTNLSYGDVVDYSSAHITLSDGRNTGIYSGNFTYSNTGLSGGTVTGYKSYEYGVLQFEASGASLSALTVSNYLDRDDGLGLYQYALSGNDLIYGSGANDILIGWGGNDTIYGSSGNDQLFGLAGNDFIDGGSGINTAYFTANMRDMSFVVSNNVITVTDRTGENGQDKLANIQELYFNDHFVTLPNPLQYIASNRDLIEAFRMNTDAAMSHFLNSGFYEGRTTTFDALKYTASYKDLIIAFSTDTNLAAAHYIQSGLAEGRALTFDALKYTASYADLINAFGVDTNLATVHYIQSGLAEGRTASFNALKYTASYSDLINAFGTDTKASTFHYVNNGYAEGRNLTFDATFYLAKYGDLRAAFNVDENLAINHFITTGSKEGRSSDSRGDDILVGSDFKDHIKSGDGNDTIIAGAGNDILNGGTGNNILDGGAGMDIFVFDTAIGGINVTTISNFNTVDDQIYLDNHIFIGLEAGTLSHNAFTSGATASNTDSQIIFNPDNGYCLYDIDGLGGGGAVHFATLVGISGNLTSSDFIII